MAGGVVNTATIARTILHMHVKNANLGHVRNMQTYVHGVAGGGGGGGVYCTS